MNPAMLQCNFQCLIGMECKSFAMIAGDQLQTRSFAITKNATMNPAMLQCNFQCLIGMECKSFAMIAADQLQTRSFAITKNDENKLHEIKNKIILGVNGDPGDIVQFSQYVDKNIVLYGLRHGYDLSTEAVVHFTRKTQIESSFIVNTLIGGFDEDQGGQLYYLDALGSSHRQPFAAHGYAGCFPLSLLQHEYHRNLTVEQAYEILQLCVCEITQRMFLNMGSFRVKVVDKNGITELPVITGSCFF